MSTCDRLNLQTLGSQPIMPKNLPKLSALQLPKVLQLWNVTTCGFVLGQINSISVQGDFGHKWSRSAGYF